MLPNKTTREFQYRKARQTTKSNFSNFAFFTLIACAIFLATAFATPFKAQAKELSNRLGVGFRTAPLVNIPLVSLQYYPSSDTGLVAGLGVDTLEKNSRLALLGGIRQLVFKENNLNFFWGGNLTMLTVETAGESKSGFDLGVVFGTEFFFSGLENLGFNIESGVGVSNVDKVRFRTLGQSFVQAGVHFYF